MPSRKSGYYWVRFDVTWRVAQYISEFNCWFITDGSQKYKDYDFKEIDEERITRDHKNLLNED